MLIILAAVLLLYSPFCLAGRVFVPQDWLNFVYPWKPLAKSTEVKNPDLLDIPTLFFPIESFVNRSLKQGDIPLWNPQIFCGHPIFASGQSGLFYPPKLALHWLFSPEVARSWSMLLHTAGAAIFMFAFLRLKGFRSRPCLLGATVWCLNGQMVGWAEYDHIMLMATQLPLMLLGFEQGRRGKTWGWPLLAVSGALCLHSGHLQLSFYAGLVLIAYAAYSLTTSPNLKHAVAFLGAGVVVVLLAAPTLLPFAELLRNSARQDLSFADIQEMASSLGALLLTLLHPDLLGNPTSGFMLNRVPNNLIYAEFADYCGALPLLLVLTGGWKSRILARKEWSFWAGFGILMLLFASASPLYWVVTKLVPPLAKAIPGRSLLAFGFVMAILSCNALDQWLEREDISLRWGALGYASIGLIAWSLTAYLLSSRPAFVLSQLSTELKLPPRHPDQSIYHQQILEGLWQNYTLNIQFAIVIVGLMSLVGLWNIWDKHRKATLIVATTFLELSTFFWVYTPTVTRDQVLPLTPSIRYLQQQEGHFRAEKYSSGWFDLLTLYGVSVVTGYDSVVQRPVFEALRLTDPEESVNMRTIGLRDFTHPFLRHAGIKYLMVGPLVPPQIPTIPSNWEKVFEEEVTIYRNPDVLPRVYLASKVELVDGLEQTLERLAAPDFEHGKTVILDLPTLLSGTPVEGEAQITSYGADRVVVQVESDNPAVLVLNDALYDGWQVQVDGEEANLLRANGVFRAVPVSQGTHQVVFSFHPNSLRRGLTLAAVGIILTLLWLLSAWKRRTS